MAKEDFCFNYYDGDASRDMAHMNRLERGAYNDFIISQRKFGHLSLELIKKTMGNDFNEVWVALEIILMKDGEDKYFIEWLENSIKKMKKQSGHQSENGKKGGRPKSETKANRNPNESQTCEKIKPLGNGYEIENEFKGGVGEKFLVPEMFLVFKKSIPTYPGETEKDFKPLLAIANFISLQLNCTGPPGANMPAILAEWATMVNSIKADSFYSRKSLATISNHIQEIFQKKNNDTHTRSPPFAKTGTGKSAGANELLAMLDQKLRSC
ncbi:MAG: hypothetical protein ABI760_25440 [Ferruginibacter sp.]